MRVQIAFDLDKTRKISFQADFPHVTKCCRCKGEARLAFVVEDGVGAQPGKFVCNLYENDPEGKGFWLHDACCVAVYFCKKCLEPTALYNQA